MSPANPFDKMNQRELLLLVNQRLERIELDFKEFRKSEASENQELIKRISKLEQDVVAIKTKLAIWATLIGAAAGVISSILTRLIQH